LRTEESRRAAINRSVPVGGDNGVWSEIEDADERREVNREDEGDDEGRKRCC